MTHEWYVQVDGVDESGANALVAELKALGGVIAIPFGGDGWPGWFLGPESVSALAWAYRVALATRVGDECTDEIVGREYGLEECEEFLQDRADSERNGQEMAREHPSPTRLPLRTPGTWGVEIQWLDDRAYDDRPAKALAEELGARGLDAMAVDPADWDAKGTGVLSRVH